MAKIDGGEIEFVKVNTGFAPYWSPAPGKGFTARLLSRDERDSEFVRYVFEVIKGEVPCASGPKDAQIAVTAKVGDHFAVSSYATLAPIFDEYMNAGISPIVNLKAVSEEKASKPGQTFWKFDLQISKTEQMALQAHHQQIRSGRANIAIAGQIVNGNRAIGQ